MNRLICQVYNHQTFAEFQDAMLEAAKEIQGGNYPGDGYYRDVCWMENWKNGDDPRETVLSDMDYWERSE